MQEQQEQQKQYITNRKDLIKQSDLPSKSHYIICIDITKFDNKHSLFCALDLAARNVIGHCFKDSPIQTEDILECIQKIIDERDFLPTIQIIHSDRESIFRNFQYENFIESKQITISRASALGHNNQVIERTFRTIKGLLRKKICLENSGDKKKYFHHLKHFSEKIELVTNAIEDYNNKPHKFLKGIYPNDMENALFMKQKSVTIVEKDLIPLLAKNDGGINGTAIETFRNQVALEYCENWRQDFKNTMVNGFKLVVTQNNHLYQQNLELKNSFQVVQKEIEIMRDARIQKEERSLKRKNASSQKLRQAISEEEFLQTLQLIKQNNFVASRRKAALILLYITGLRVSNLLKLTIQNMKQFFDKGETLIDLIKRGQKKHKITYSEKSIQLIKINHSHFFELMKKKSHDQYLFTKGATTTICRNL